MGLSASTVSALVEKEIARVSSSEAAALIRSLLVPPRCEDRPWDYDEPGEKYPCWIVAEHPASRTGIGYCEKGFGPKCPWGLLWLSEHLNMGADYSWFSSLEAAV